MNDDKLILYYYDDGLSAAERDQRPAPSGRSWRIRKSVISV